MPDASQPRIIADKYVVGPLLGRGAVGDVYLARHRLTGAEVALKVIPSRMIGSEPSLQRFHREVSVANRVGHPGMVKVHDAGWSEAEDAYYLAMERLSGESLGAWAEGSEVDLRSAVQVVRAMLEPLAAAHAAGIVHRDLKPENVFLHRDPRSGEQLVKLLDFGIARDQRELLSATLADITLGTPAYMSPEQATSAKEATPASDVWSAGVILYWLYSGRLPFEGETVFNTLTAICTVPHPPLDGHSASELALIAVIEGCLRKDPAERYPDAAALGTALDRWLSVAGELPVAPRPRADTEVRPFGGDPMIRGLTLVESPPVRRRLLLGLVSMTLAVGLGWWTWRAPEPPRLAAPTPAPERVVTPPSAVVPAEVAAPLTQVKPESAEGPSPTNAPPKARSRPEEVRRRRPEAASIQAQAQVEETTVEAAAVSPSAMPEPEPAEALMPAAPPSPQAAVAPALAPSDLNGEPSPAKADPTPPAPAAAAPARAAPAPKPAAAKKPFVTF